jgi:hypothetical protein
MSLDNYIFVMLHFILIIIILYFLYIFHILQCTLNSISNIQENLIINYTTHIYIDTVPYNTISLSYTPLNMTY